MAQVPASPSTSETHARTQPWQATVVTALPDCFPGPLGHSLAGQALKDRIWALKTIALRDFGIGKHKSIDDTPAGGGAGMVLRADVVGPALHTARDGCPDAPLVYLSPRGTPLIQSKVQHWANGPGLTLLAGRFEGVDQRVLDALEIEEVSIGDYVLAGGEVAAMAVLEACVRLLPGVMGDPDSLAEESFNDGLLEYPHYTRPRSWEGHDIPEVLLSGDHAKISRWRKDAAFVLTKARRPDLLKKRTPDD